MGKINQTLATIRDRITDGTYKPNDRMPSQLELSAELGVSSHTVREATRRLEADGFVYTLRTVGTFVCPKGGMPKIPVRSPIRNFVRNTIRLRIIDGTYPPHSRLPPQEDLARELDVSEAVVAQAARDLKELAYVDIRRPRGVFVRSPGFWPSQTISRAEPNP